MLNSQSGDLDSHLNINIIDVKCVNRIIDSEFNTSVFSSSFTGFIIMGHSALPGRAALRTRASRASFPVRNHHQVMGQLSVYKGRAAKVHGEKKLVTGD